MVGGRCREDTRCHRGGFHFIVRVIGIQAGGDVRGMQVHVKVVDVCEKLAASTSADRMLSKAAEVCLLKQTHGPRLRPRDAPVPSSAHVHGPYRPRAVQPVYSRSRATAVT